MGGSKGGGSGGGGTTIVQSSAQQNAQPWSEQQNYLKTLFSEADKLRQTGGPQYFPGQTLATPSPYSGQAIDLTAQRALQGSPITGAAEQQTTDTLQGKYLDPSSNPWLNATFNQGADQLENRFRTAWGGSDVNPGSSGMNQAALGKSQADLATQIYGGNYANERMNQQRALALAPQTANMGYTDLAQLSQAGAAQEQQGQKSINDQISRYNYEQNLPYLNLQNYGKLVSGDYGGTATSTQQTPYFNSGLGSAGKMGLAGLGGLGAGKGLGLF